MNKIILKKGREHSLERRHPWIFSGAVAETVGNPVCGETVAVYGADGKYLACGAYAPDSQIRVKIWSFEETEINETFFREKVRQAYELRKTVFHGILPDAWRLINAESDGLPGIVADIYGKYAVCQITGAGMDFHRETMGKILLDYAEGVYERSDVESRVKDGLEMRTGLLCGRELPAQIEFTENGIRYKMDPRTGHKTGFYLDQRCSRKAVMEAACGRKNVLNCFAYTGGFGLAALKGGAEKVINIDSSAPALGLAAENAALNGFGPDRFLTQTADVFEYLRKCRDSRKTFDMIILDPPKFAESLSQRERAARAYKDINLLAMKLLEKGGSLYTFSCSGAMEEALFAKVVDSAANDAGRDFRITEILAQGPDHPVSAAFPEGRYLKGFGGVVF